jgi:hypothetical protein
VFQAGGLALLVTALEQHLADAELRVVCCAALGVLCEVHIGCVERAIEATGGWLVVAGGWGLGLKGTC